LPPSLLRSADRDALRGDDGECGRLQPTGMAYVFLARAEGHTGFAKLAVLKRLKLAENQDIARMFLQEARLAAQLNHAINLLDFGIARSASPRRLEGQSRLHGPGAGLPAERGGWARRDLFGRLRL